jgi:hypothetical protein
MRRRATHYRLKNHKYTDLYRGYSVEPGLSDEFSSSFACDSISAVKLFSFPHMSTETVYFPSLPDQSPIWIHMADRQLTSDEANALISSVSAFMRSWTSHERNVLGDAILLHNQLLIIGAHIPGGDISGCGIDKHLQLLKRISNELQFGWTNSLSVIYRDASDDIQIVSRSEFKRIVREESLPDSTHVFDLSLNMLGIAREQGIERPAFRSWHGRYFGFTSRDNIGTSTQKSDPALI